MNENCTENVGVWGSGLMIVTKYADRPFLGGQQDNGAVNNTTAARAKALEKNRSSVNKYVYFVVTVGNISMCKNSRESILLRYEKWRYRRRSPYIIHTMPPSYFISFLLHYFAVDHCINCLVAPSFRNRNIRPNSCLPLKTSRMLAKNQPYRQYHTDTY